MPSTSNIAGALAAIEARLAANWTTTPIVYENSDPPQTPWPPVDGGNVPQPYVFVEIISVEAGIIGFGKPGDQTLMDTGLVKMHVMVPNGSGLLTGRTHATALGEIFRQKVFYNTDPTAYVRTKDPRVGREGVASDDGNWASVSCTVPYEFTYQA